MNKEVRIIEEDSELRAAIDSRMVEGYGIVFNRESRDLGGFTEIILPSAIKGVVERSDVLALMNHDISRGVLARCTNGAGSLSLTPDQRGVKYSFKSPSTALGSELVEGISRKDIKGSSFAFTVSDGGEKWEHRSGGVPLRTISQFDLIYDMSPCYRATYQDTTIALRSLDEYKKSTEVVEEVKPNPIAEEPAIENLDVNKTIPRYSNAELAMRARNEMYKNNI